MRHSLPLRLLGLCVTVAVFAIAATAWIMLRDTGERFRGEFERTLEADTHIYRALLGYAANHDSWDGVGALVAELAGQTGRRVTLTDLDGTTFADSAETSGGDTAAGRPASPTAEIDATSAGTLAGTVTSVSYEGDMVVADAVDAFGPLPGDMPGSVAFSASPLWPGVSPLWRLTVDEADARRTLAAEAQSCLQDEYDDEGEVVVGPAGEIFILAEVGDPGTAADGAADAVAPEQVAERLSSVTIGGVGATSQPCVPDELGRPSQAALDLNVRSTTLYAECLDGAGVPYHVVASPRGYQQLVPDETGAHDAVSRCSYDSSMTALADFVAEPALLYTGSGDRFHPLSGDGLWRTLLAGGGVLGIAAGVTVLAGRRLTRPLTELTAAARRMGGGDGGVRVDVGGRDQVAELANAFNAMAESIETSRRQRKAMVSDIAHELRNPLANVRGYLEAAEDGVVPLDPALVTSLLEESTLLQRLVDDLQELALADAGELSIQPEPCDATDLARQVVAAHRAGADEAGVTLTIGPTDADGPDAGRAEAGTAGVSLLPVTADPGRIRQALGNLVANAVRFAPAGGHVTVTAYPDGPVAVLEVRDDGPGIAAEHLPRLFDRFSRVEASRSRETGGSGLGLAIARYLVEAHGGTIEVSSEPGRGSTFAIRLPRGGPTSVVVTSPRTGAW